MKRKTQLVLWNNCSSKVAEPRLHALLDTLLSHWSRLLGSGLGSCFPLHISMSTSKNVTNNPQQATARRFDLISTFTRLD